MDNIRGMKVQKSLNNLVGNKLPVVICQLLPGFDDFIEITVQEWGY